MDDDDFLNIFYNTLMNDVNDIPLRSFTRNNVSQDVQDALIINRNLIQNFTNMRSALFNSRSGTEIVYEIDHVFEPQASNILSVFESFSDIFNYQGEQDLEDVKVTLTKEQFDKLEKCHIDSNLQKTTCNICLDDYTNSNVAIHLKCKHMFHVDCIEHWLCMEKTTCPVCRMDVRDGTKEKNNNVG
jgi:hypothetical protein